jgi:hypothetical protein
MAKSDITKITAYSNAFVARSYNKRINYTKQDDGNILIEFVRYLSKEEQIKLKDAPNEGTQFVLRGRVFVATMLFAPETIENIKVFLNVLQDLDSEVYTKTVEI